MKKSLIALIVIFSLSLLFIGCENKISDETMQELNFHNEEYGFGVKYPEEILLKRGRTLWMRDDKTTPFIQISRLDIDYRSLEKLVIEEHSLEGETLEEAEYSYQTINDNNFLKLYKPTQYDETYYYTVKHRKIALFTVYYSTDENIALAEEIMASLIYDPS